MPEGLIPPVVATFAANYADMVAGTEAVIGSLETVQATAVEVSEGASAAMSRMGVAAEGADGQLSLFGEAATRAGEQLSLFAVEADRVAAQVDTSTTTVAGSMDRMSASAAGAAAKWDVEMATMAASMDKMSANVDVAAANAAAANEKLAGTTGEKFDTMRSKLMQVAGDLASFGLKLGAVAAGAAIATTMMAGTFDQKMELIRTNAHDSTDSIDAMSKAVLGMAGDVGQTPDKLAEGLYHITSTGQRGAQALDILKASAKDATIGLADLDTVTYAMSGVMSVGMVDIRNAADGVALLNTIVGQGDMHMQDLAKAIGTGVLPTFKNAGLGAIDFGAALSTLTDNSTPAEVAANHLKTSVMLLQNQSKPAQAALADLGIQTGQLASDISKPGGLMVAVMDLKTHMDNYSKSAGGMKMSQDQINVSVQQMAAELTKEGTSTQEQTDLLAAYRDSLNHMGSAGVQAAADLAKAFGGARSAMTMETLVQESGKLQSKYAEMGTSASRQAQAQQDWNDTQAQFKVKLDQAKASAEALGISVGNLLLPFVIKVMDAFKSFSTVLEHHQGLAKALAVIIGGALLTAIALVTTATIMWAIAIQGTPLGWVFDIIVGLVAVTALLVANWSSIAGFFGDVWKAVVGFFTDAGHDIGQIIGDIIHWVSRLPDEVGHALSSFGSMLGRLATDGWHAFTHGLEVAWQATLNFLKHLPYELGYALGWLAGTLTRLAIDGWNAFTHGLQVAFVATVTFFTTTLPNAIVGFFQTAPGWLEHAGEMILTGLWNGITAGARAVWSFFTTTVPNNIVGFFSTAPGWLWTSGNAVIHGLWNGITTAAGAVWSFFSALPGNIGGFFKDVGNWLFNAGLDLLKGLVHGIEAGAGWVWNQIKSFAAGIVSGFKAALGISSPSRVMAEEIGKWLPAGLAQGITDNTHLAVAAAKNAANSVVNGFGGGASINLSVTGGGSLASSGAASSSLPPIQVNFSLNTNDAKAFLQGQTLRYNLRNSGNGLVVATK